MTTTQPTDSAAMTAAEFRVITESLGLDQRQVARLLGVDERTVRRWVAGTAAIPAGVADELGAIQDETGELIEEIIRTLIAEGPGPDGESWVMTYATDASYLAHHPDADMPASWHRAAMGRVRDAVPWVRLHYAGGEP